MPVTISEAYIERSIDIQRYRRVSDRLHVTATKAIAIKKTVSELQAQLYELDRLLLLDICERDRLQARIGEIE